MKHEGAFEDSGNAGGSEWDMTPPGESEASTGEGEGGEFGAGDPGGFENWGESGGFVDSTGESDTDESYEQGSEADPSEIEQERKKLFERIISNKKARRVFVGLLAVTAALIVAISARNNQDMINEPVNSPSSGIEMVDSGTRPQEQSPGDSVGEATPAAPIAPSLSPKTEATPPDSRATHYSQEIRFYRPDAGGGGENFGPTPTDEEAAEAQKVREAIDRDESLARMLEDVYGITSDSISEVSIEILSPEE